MTFRYKDQEYRYPVTLRDITLQQRIEFDALYGKALAERAGELEVLFDDLDKEVAIMELHAESAVKSFSFFTGILLEEVQEHIDLHQVIAVFQTSLAALLQQEGELAPMEGIFWQGKLWFIGAPELTAESGMTFNEFLVSKEIVRQMAALGSGRWDVLPYLCAIYLRKDGEAFNESFIAADSERLMLMRDVPMDIALSVAFFLSSTMHIWTSILPSSEKDEVKAPISARTSIAGDGYPSSPT